MPCTMTEPCSPQGPPARVPTLGRETGSSAAQQGQAGVGSYSSSKLKRAESPNPGEARGEVTAGLGRSLVDTGKGGEGQGGKASPGLDRPRPWPPRQPAGPGLPRPHGLCLWFSQQ